MWSFMFAMPGFWPVQFSNGRPGASHERSDSVMVGLVCLSRKYSLPFH